MRECLRWELEVVVVRLLSPGVEGSVTCYLRSESGSLGIVL